MGSGSCDSTFGYFIPRRHTDWAIPVTDGSWGLGSQSCGASESEVTVVPEARYEKRPIHLANTHLTADRRGDAAHWVPPVYFGSVAGNLPPASPAFCHQSLQIPQTQGSPHYQHTHVTTMMGSNWRLRNAGGRHDLMPSAYQMRRCNTSSTTVRLPGAPNGAPSLERHAARCHSPSDPFALTARTEIVTSYPGTRASSSLTVNSAALSPCKNEMAANTFP